MSLRVLLVGPRGHGGEEVYLRTLVENPPEGVIYTLAGSFHEGAPGAPCRAFEEILLNRLIHPWLPPDMGMRSLRLEERFDLVHVHAHPVRLGALGRVPLVMSEGSSSAVYLRDYLNWDEGRLARGYARARQAYRLLGIHDRLLNLRQVSRVYVFSRWARDLNLRWGADPAKIQVVYPGFPTPPERPSLSDRGFEFLFVGTDFERKGGFEVVEAFDLISQRRSDVRLVLVTSDPWLPNPDRAFHSWVSPERKERVLVRLTSLEAAGRIARFPLGTRSELYSDRYPKADAFVMPSHAEGFGFTNVEALSFGLPVISSSVGAIPEAVLDGRSGLLVPTGDIEALAAAMERLVDDRDLASRLGRAGREDFLTRFTLERFRSELGRVYNEAQCVAS